MTKVLVTDTYLEDIADAIRGLTEIDYRMKPRDMASKIRYIAWIKFNTSSAENTDFVIGSAKTNFNFAQFGITFDVSAEDGGEPEGSNDNE